MNINAINYTQYQNRYNKANLRNAEPQPIQTASSEVSFKGGFGDKVGKVFGEKYAQKMLDKPWMHTLSTKLASASKLMTQHMATLGSFLTSAVYFIRTITNKDLDPEKRNTLGINQIGCFVVPTGCAYGVDHGLRKFNKNMEYRYSGLKRQQMALGKISPEKCAALEKSLGTKLKCFGALMGLATFTTIYRYATPVLITPVANKLGDWWNNRNKGKNQESVISSNNMNKENAQINRAA